MIALRISERDKTDGINVDNAQSALWGALVTATTESRRAAPSSCTTRALRRRAAVLLATEPSHSLASSLPSAAAGGGNDNSVHTPSVQPAALPVTTTRSPQALALCVTSLPRPKFAKATPAAREGREMSNYFIRTWLAAASVTT
jgi:hypothetical protein